MIHAELTEFQLNLFFTKLLIPLANLYFFILHLAIPCPKPKFSNAKLNPSQPLAWVVFILLGGCRSTHELQSIPAMSAKNFHQYVRGVAEAVREGQSSASVDLKLRLEERVNAQLMIFDSTQVELVRLFRYLEGELNNGYAETQGVIELLIGAGYPGPVALTEMVNTKAEIHEWSENRDYALSLRQENHRSLTDLKYQTDLKWGQNQVQMGYDFIYLNRNAEAEPFFLDVLSYPYTLVEDVDMFHQFRELYIEAGKGLIQVRKGNAEALQEIYFIPAMQSILGPIKEEALEKAKQ